MPSETKYDIAKLEWELTQKQMDKYDDLSARVKTWAVTLWVALMGWSWQANDHNILLLAALVAVAFWLLDSVEKNFRQDYAARRHELAEALRQYANSEQWPTNFASPSLPRHRTAPVLRYMLELHVLLVYLPLLVIALALYWLKY